MNIFTSIFMFEKRIYSDSGGTCPQSSIYIFTYLPYILVNTAKYELNNLQVDSVSSSSLSWGASTAQKHKIISRLILSSRSQGRDGYNSVYLKNKILLEITATTTAQKEENHLTRNLKDDRLLSSPSP